MKKAPSFRSMVSTVDINFAQSTAAFLCSEIRDTIPSEPSPPEAAEQPHLHQGVKDFVALYGEKRVVLDIDLNVALNVDEDFDFPEVNYRGVQVNGRKFWREAANNVSENGVEAHFSEIIEIRSVKKKDLGYNNRRWAALLEAAEIASAVYEECPTKREGKVIQIEQRNQNHDAGSTAVEVAPPLLRLRRERAAALPNKYRDSVLDYTAEAAIIATKRKFSRFSTCW
ncbi:uncharacterized protein LOC142541606 isoform X1 [Primulina tabacum]|uniref:uncharacterized protein LOC142541606 isoform X1 n=2 Tax=Primulina tabacum TaxID=48773 RepID=UPI003F59ECC9